MFSEILESSKDGDYTLPGQPDPLPDCTHGEKIIPHLQSEPALVQFMPIVFNSSTTDFYVLLFPLKKEHVCP